MSNIDILLSIASKKEFDKNEVVFMQNDVGDNMYIVLKGTFGVYINSFTDFPIRIAEVPSGSFFGEMSIIDGWPRSATIISESIGSALVVEKDKFGLMLENSPDIVENILKSLKSRVLSTIETVRASGKEVEELPEALLTIKTENAKQALKLMTIWAQKIRQLNDMLSSDDIKNIPVPTAKSDILRLLPEGYVPYHIEEYNDNLKMLQLKMVTCPYCHKVVKSYIPLFSNLTPKMTTLDQRIIYEKFNILWYTNIVCPNCNYTDTYQEFGKGYGTDVKETFDGNQFVNIEKFEGFETTYRHTLDEVVLSYYLNIECIKQTANNPLKLGKAWIRLYWLYCDNDSNELAEGAAREAYDCYILYLQENKNHLNTEDKMKMNAILGELSVFLKRYEEARSYFKENTVLGRLDNNDLVQKSVKRYAEIRGM